MNPVRSLDNGATIVRNLFEINTDWAVLQKQTPNGVKNMLFFIAIFLLLAGEAYAAGNGIETATTTPSVVENVSPEAIFDQIRGFLTFPMPNLNITTPTLEMPDFDMSGIQNLNDQIREITGVDILQFLNFLWNIFLSVLRYIADLLSRTAG